jgi:hypothetical protein
MASQRSAFVVIVAIAGLFVGCTTQGTSSRSTVASAIADASVAPETNAQTPVAPSTCSVKNAQTGATFGVAQDAVDASPSASTLRISGTCVGRISIAHKTLRLLGAATAEHPRPILDGKSKRVLTVTGARVVVRDLTLTDGRAVWGGGAMVTGSYAHKPSTLVLQGTTLVTGNAATSGGGGIDVEQGATLKMFGSSTIAHNVSKWYGGGIGGLGTIVLNDTVSISHNVGDVGGGVAINEPGTLIINDRASIKRNVASKHGGGVVNYYGTVILNDAAAIVANTAERTGGGVRNYGRTSVKGVVYICSDRVRISPNGPDDAPDALYACS